MQHYDLDYTLPFVPFLARMHKPVILVEIESRSTYFCISTKGKASIHATGRTPIDALNAWECKFKKMESGKD